MASLPPTRPPRASPLATDQRSTRGGNRVRRSLLHALAVLHRWAEAGWSGPATALWALGQGAVVPGPAEAVFAPLALADAKRAFRLAAWALLGSVLGGCLAYAIGAGGLGVLGWMGVERGAIEGMRARFDSQGALLIFIGAVAPLIPMKIVNIAAGALGMPFPSFALALLAGRAVRYLFLGLVFRFAGERLNERLRKTLGRGLEELK